MAIFRQSEATFGCLNDEFDAGIGLQTAECHPRALEIGRNSSYPEHFLNASEPDLSEKMSKLWT
jgi:hypothetical protein